MSMDWSNERYVRFYTRDTVTWKRWTWEARSCWGLLLRKVDRSGLLDTGTTDKVDALALMLDIPCEVAHRVVPQWLSAGSLVERSTGFSVPTFLAAQEAKQSDKLRQSESRANRLAASLRNDEGVCHTPSQAVTAGHTVSQPVTPAVPSRAVPSRVPAVAEPKKTKSKVEKKTDPRHPVVVADFDRAFRGLHGKNYPYAKADFQRITRLLERASPQELLEAWQRALAHSGFPTIATLEDFERHLPRFIGTGPPGSQPRVMPSTSETVIEITQGF